MESARFLERRPLGKTGLMASPLALSAWSVRAAGEAGLKLTPDDIEKAYYEQGINTFLVTWQMKPVIEGIRGLIRAGHRDDLVLIAEVGIPAGFFIRRGFEKNARALGVDAIDVFLLGWVQAHWYVTGGCWPEMRKLKAEGKVRAIGYSSHNRLLATRIDTRRRAGSATRSTRPRAAAGGGCSARGNSSPASRFGSRKPSNGRPFPKLLSGGAICIYNIFTETAHLSRSVEG